MKAVSLLSHRYLCLSFVLYSFNTFVLNSCFQLFLGNDLVRYQIQEIVLSADISCSDCQEKIADIMSRMIGEKYFTSSTLRQLFFFLSHYRLFLVLLEAETYSILVSVLEKKVTLTCTYSGDRRVSKSYGEALLCKISTIKRMILPSSRKQQLSSIA